MKKSMSHNEEPTLKLVDKAIDLMPLVGFRVEAVENVEGDGCYILFSNGRNVVIDMLYDWKSICISKPYGVDANGNRVVGRN